MRYLVLAALAQLADAFTFVLALLLGVPISRELNPLARAIYDAGGLPATLTAKGLAVVASLALLSVAYRYAGPRLPVVIVALLLAFVGVLGALSNLAALPH